MGAHLSPLFLIPIVTSTHSYTYIFKDIYVPVVGWGRAGTNGNYNKFNFLTFLSLLRLPNPFENISPTIEVSWLLFTLEYVLEERTFSRGKSGH